MRQYLQILALLLVFAAAAPLAAQDINSINTLGAADEQPQLAERQVEDDFQLVIETVRERYPNGKIKLLREVARTVDLNYVNHGQFNMWDEDGNVIASGEFHAGQRVGKWTRTYDADESPLFAKEPFKKFDAPFTSEATFKNGKLHGTWTISDSLGRKVSEINFKDGLRDGALVYHFPSGTIAREVDYRNGDMHGMDRTYDEEGNTVSEYKYVDGQRHAMKSTFYLGSKGKKQEIFYLHPKTEATAKDDWWNATLAAYESAEGTPVRHGRYEAWHINGQQSVSGEYRYGKPHGGFTWWHANGQVNIRGSFDDGKHSGMWHWWHPNGMKKAEGAYEGGAPAGRWLTWSDNGELDKIKQYDEESPQQDVADTPAEEETEENAATDQRMPELLRIRSVRDSDDLQR